MKLLVFAHTPPPHHGQSYMVQQMLEGFGGDARRSTRHPSPSVSPGPARPDYGIRCYHVNARVSKGLDDIGDLRLGKFVLLLGYCAQAIWCRFRHGVDTFYYVPAPGKRWALCRDWMVMWLCRPFFKRLILHWHAAGLGKWLETAVQIRSRSLTFKAFHHADLSVVLSNFNRYDAEKLFARKILSIPNGIPDPCPDFEREILPRRLSRLAERKRLLQDGKGDTGQVGAESPRLFKVAFLGHCTRQKGLFDTLLGVDRANEILAAERSALRVQLNVAGQFVSQDERAEFDAWLAARSPTGLATYAGFVGGEEKKRFLTESDCLCFPSFYEAENFPIVLVEVMAYGLPVVTTRWRSIPELFPADYPGLVPVRNPDQIAHALIKLMTSDIGQSFRNQFLKDLTIDRHLAQLAAALASASSPPVAAPAAA